jgi:hypothetical protein
MGTGKRRRLSAVAAREGQSALPQSMPFGLICEEADAAIEYGELSFLEVLATIRANDEQIRFLRVQQGQIP